MRICNNIRPNEIALAVEFITHTKFNVKKGEHNKISHMLEIIDNIEKKLFLYLPPIMIKGMTRDARKLCCRAFDSNRFHDFIDLV